MVERKQNRKRRFIYKVLCVALVLWIIQTEPAQAGLSAWGVDKFLGTMLNALKEWALWLICLLVELVWPMVELIANQVPTGWGGYVGDFMQYVRYMNYWVSIDVGFGLFTLVLGFSLIFYTVKIIIKLVPFGIG